MIFFLKDRIAERGERQNERKKVIFHPLVNFSNACNTWDWTGLMLGSRSFIQISHNDGRKPSIGRNLDKNRDELKSRHFGYGM